MEMNDDRIKEIEPGVFEAPKGVMQFEDNTEANVERTARAFIAGVTRVARHRDIRGDLEEKVTKRIGQKGKYLVDKLFELIEGVYLTDKIGKHEIRYYKKPPNLQAIVYALDRVLGKPTQHVEQSDAKKGIYVVEAIIKNLAGGAPVSTVNPTLIAAPHGSGNENTNKNGIGTDSGRGVLGSAGGVTRKRGRPRSAATPQS
jgi:hypothetical protein